MRHPVPRIIIVLLLLAPAATPRDTLAQVPTLDRADSLVTAGDYDAARNILDGWWSARDQFDVPGSDMARALMLRAQLAPDPETAEPDYLAVVIGYPTSPHAPQALLRLGQGLLAEGDATRAAAYLERLVADYPGRPERLPALLWLARANNIARRPAAACSAAQRGIQDTRDPDMRAMLEVEAAASCAVGADASQPEQPAERRPAQRPAQQPRQDTGADRTASGSISVQAGAFRYRESADNLMEQLREAGHQPRLVRIPESGLLRVRVGRFPSDDGARALIDRLRDQGFDAVLVRDVADERQP
jgi:cell division septation protein DedD